MESVLENGPWLIRLVPLILNEWTPNTILKKDEIKSALVWVKMHHVPIVAYSKVGLSLITTQIGKPIMLDSYTSNMCLNSWGRSTYARALIEISTDMELKKYMVIAIPLCNKEGYTFATIDIDYEWSPPRCASCKKFDHVSDKCPKLPKMDPPVKVTDDGFIEVKKKKTKAKQNNKRQVEGVRLTKPALNLQYRRVDKGETSKNKVPSTSENKKSTDFSFHKPHDETIKVATMNSLDRRRILGLGTMKTDGRVKKIILMSSMIVIARRGMNLSPKQNEVWQVIFENKLSVCAILESHVADHNLERMCKYVFSHWDWVSNAMTCTKGTRIIVGWNHNDVDVTVIHQDSQVIHTRVWLKADRKEFFCSFIYAHNNYTQRRPLWNGLCLHKNYIRNRPWCLLGDFNASLFAGDTSTGSSVLGITMREFKECVESIEVMDVQRTGLQFTLNQKPK
ncbi:putative reverse transcriptase domain-containing protein, partial [Tanacetum coccineum]